jgi:lysophospholipid acyltransferase (LPLAT)-like uncharacterized protein|tara:strand:- start:440 stop:670 length:231 start_codon:yes stop_codon:yes gene_type:complete
MLLKLIVYRGIHQGAASFVIDSAIGKLQFDVFALIFTTQENKADNYNNRKSINPKNFIVSGSAYPHSKIRLRPFYN